MHRRISIINSINYHNNLFTIMSRNMSYIVTYSSRMYFFFAHLLYCMTLYK